MLEDLEMDRGEVNRTIESSQSRALVWIDEHQIRCAGLEFRLVKNDCIPPATKA